METIIIENRDEEKSITHPQFGKVRYFIIKGRPWLVRADVSRAFGLKEGSGHRINIVEQSLRVVTTYRKATNPIWILINDEGLKLYSVDGKKNLQRRAAIKNWLLRELYGEQIDEPQTLFKDTPTPLTLSPAQMNELVRRVTDLLRFEPLKIVLSDEAKKEVLDDLRLAFETKVLIPTNDQLGYIIGQVVAILQDRPITLSEKQMDDIAYKVLALIGDVQPNEDAIVNRVVDKLNAGMRITL